MITWVKDCSLDASPAEMSKAYWMMRARIVNAIREISRDTEFEIFFVGGLPRREILSAHLIRESGLMGLMRDGAPIEEIERKPLPNGAFVAAGTDIDIYVDGVVKDDRADFLKDFTQRIAKITGYLIKLNNNRTDYSDSRFLIHTGCHPLARRMSIGLDVSMEASGVADVDVNQLTLNAKGGAIQLGRPYEKNLPYKWWEHSEFAGGCGEFSFFSGGEDRRRDALKVVLEKIQQKRATLLILPYIHWHANMTFLGLKVSPNRYIAYVEKLLQHRLKKLVDDGFIVSGLKCSLRGHEVVCPQCHTAMDLQNTEVFFMRPPSPPSPQMGYIPLLECDFCSGEIEIL